MLKLSFYRKFCEVRNAQSDKVKSYLNLVWLLFLIADLEICLLIGGFIAGVFFDYKKGLFYYALSTDLGRIAVIFFFLMSLYLIFIRKVKSDIVNTISEIDENGVPIMKNGTFGTSKLMDEDEIRDTFKVGNINDCNSTIYGCLNDSNDVVSRDMNEKTLANNNLLIIGGSGSGKSTGRILPDIYMCIKNGESYAMLDVKGEGYQTTAKHARNQGYDILVFNLADPNHSNFWPMLKETISQKTERMDETKLDEFVYTFMKNIQAVENAGKPNQFFMNMGIALLKSVIAFMAWRREKFLLDGYREIFKTLCIKGKNISGLTQWYSSNKYAFSDSGQDKNDRFTKANFVECKRLIRTAAERVNADIDSVEKAIKEIEKKAPPYTMAEMYYLMLNYSETSEIWDQIPQNYAAWQNRAILSGGQSSGTENNAPSEDQIRSAVQNTVSDFAALQSDIFRTIISNDEIEFNNVRKKKTAIYVIIDPKNKKMIPYTSMFFTYLERAVKESWDIYKSMPEDPVKNPKPLPFAFIMDEFYSAGLIGGDPSVMVQTLSTCRSMQYRYHIVVQTYDMIASLYTPEGRNNIIGNCATLIYLGSTDLATQEYISSYSGTMTIASQSYRNSSTDTIFGETDPNISENKRAVITVDEAKGMIGKGQALIFYGGKHPCMLKQYRNYMMPDSMTERSLGDAFIIQDIKDIRERYREHKDNFTIDNIDVRGNNKNNSSSINGAGTGGDVDNSENEGSTYDEPKWNTYVHNIAGTIKYKKKVKTESSKQESIDDYLGSDFKLSNTNSTKSTASKNTDDSDAEANVINTKPKHSCLNLDYLDDELIDKKKETIQQESKAEPIKTGIKNTDELSQIRNNEGELFKTGQTESAESDTEKTEQLSQTEIKAAEQKQLTDSNDDKPKVNKKHTKKKGEKNDDVNKNKRAEKKHQKYENLELKL